MLATLQQQAYSNSKEGQLNISDWFNQVLTEEERHTKPSTSQSLFGQKLQIEYAGPEMEPKYLREIDHFRSINPTAIPPPPPKLKRIAIIGEVGIGKSLLMNSLTGVKYILNEDTGQVEKVDKRQIEPFLSKISTKSVTQETNGYLCRLFGQEAAPWVALIDIPGFNDKNAEESQYHIQDLVKKLKAMGQLDMVFLCLTHSNGGRISNSISEMIKQVYDIFQPEENFFNISAFCFIRCNKGDPTWKTMMQVDVQKGISDNFFQVQQNSQIFQQNEKCVSPFFYLTAIGQINQSGTFFNSQQPEFAKLFYHFRTIQGIQTKSVREVFDDRWLLKKLEEEFKLISSKQQLDLADINNQLNNKNEQIMAIEQQIKDHILNGDARTVVFKYNTDQAWGWFTWREFVVNYSGSTIIKHVESHPNFQISDGGEGSCFLQGKAEGQFFSGLVSYVNGYSTAKEQHLYVKNLETLEDKKDDLYIEKTGLQATKDQLQSLGVDPALLNKIRDIKQKKYTE